VACSHLCGQSECDTGKMSGYNQLHSRREEAYESLESLRSVDETTEKQQYGKKSTAYRRWVVLGALACATVFLVATNANTFIATKPMSLDSVASLSMTAYNEYGNTKTGKLPYPFLVSALLAEPYKTATFEIENTMTGCEYTWSITKVSTSQVVDFGVTDTSNFTSSELKATGEYSLSVSEGVCDYSRTLYTTVCRAWVDDSHDILSKIKHGMLVSGMGKVCSKRAVFIDG
jgi:hypothetical protein